MLTKYNIEMDDATVIKILDKELSLIFKLLPMNEEKLEWKKLLDTIIVDFLGMQSLFPNLENISLLIIKLEGLKDLDENFFMFRRTIFECCSLVDKIKKEL